MVRKFGISDAEWKVMQVLWKTSPLTANQVVLELKATIDWSPNTVKTLMSRLVKKQVLGFNKEGRTHNYFPLVSEEECVLSEGKAFLERVYGGALKPLLINFLREEKLSREEIEELKRILDEKD